MGSIYDVIHYNNNILLLQTFNWTQLNKSSPSQVFYVGSIYDVIHYNNNILLLQTFNWTQLNKSSPSQVFLCGVDI